tara:strand:+ start:1621 stop:1929 length:309 start_codon:yes stop_codon:yes gene_type:complete
MAEEEIKKKISRSEFTNAIKVAEEGVNKEMGNLRKSLDKKKITRKEYADKRMNTVREFVELRRELQQMISDDVQELYADDDEALPSKKVVNVEEDSTIKDEV